MSETPTEIAAQPLIGIPACVREIEDKPWHAVGDKYARAVLLASDALPLLIPAFGPLYDLKALVHRLDGLLLTGSLSNVHPERYGLPASAEAEPYDLERDDTTLPLIHEALAQALPLFAICRGHQELNVAMGGTLHARVHELPDRLDHRAPKDDDPDVKYGPVHAVAATPGGALEKVVGARDFQVNSLHWQAVDRVGEGLQVEAIAPDGTIEGLSVTGARAFALSVQWHPEYKVLENEISTRLFHAFGEAARERARARAAGRLAPPADGAAEAREARSA